MPCLTYLLFCLFLLQFRFWMSYKHLVRTGLTRVSRNCWKFANTIHPPCVCVLSNLTNEKEQAHGKEWCSIWGDWEGRQQCLQTATSRRRGCFSHIQHWGHESLYGGYHWRPFEFEVKSFWRKGVWCKTIPIRTRSRESRTRSFGKSDSSIVRPY